MRFQYHKDQCPFSLASRRRARHQQRIAARHYEETVEQWQDRRARNKKGMAAHRSQETPVQANSRRARNQESKAHGTRSAWLPANLKSCSGQLSRKDVETVT